VALPLLTWGLNLEHGRGVFSAESLYLRIDYTWPQALDWIQRNQMFLFGVGIGGISGAQRLYAPENFNPADNIAILMYAYFGIFALIYVGLVIYLVLRSPKVSSDRVVPAISILAFALGYGAVLSVIEDQAAAVFIGAAVGILCKETAAKKPAKAQTWATPMPRKPVRAETAFSPG
jgi:hypothetical protein